ncbi:MAG TPA: PLP-dependent cysteine synthase family protein [Microbacteriaceae bacterium]|nr:PLP-dependent cysteine synthase family protein [Microbacteriaceae bacterium]
MGSRQWVAKALALIAADANRSADTHLHCLPLPPEWGIDLYLKDESVHPTGSLKHRLARSLVLYGIVNGEIGEGTTLVEATSGSTAISEAYFARMLGLEFIAVVPRGTSSAKLDLIVRAGGRCQIVESAGDVYAEAERLGALPDHCYLDQFGNAAIVNDWRGNNTIASSIFDQLSLERHPIPSWIVVGAGTGGTSATIGRYCRYRGVDTRLAVVDPEGSVFHEAWRTGDRTLVGRGSRIEGIGRPRVEPSFVPGVIDEVLPIADAASVAGMHLIEERLGRRVGPSTGTNLVGALELIDRMRVRGERGSVVILICDAGDRYGSTYWDAAWVQEQGWAVAPELARLRGLLG